MRILFVVPYVPGLVRVRPYNLLRALAARDHAITLLTLWSNAQEREELAQLRPYCQAIHALPMPLWRSLGQSAFTALGRAPLQSVYSWRADLVRPLASQPFDVAHVEHLRGARYALFLKAHSAFPVVWDSVDCITHLFEQASAKSKNGLLRWRSQFELARTRRYEGWLVRQFDHVLITSRTDQERLRALGAQPNLPISVLPNGVDLDYFCPSPAVVREPATLIVSGKMSYHANISMTLYLAQEIMPLVWQTHPQTRLLIVGKDPTRQILALAQEPRITITGTVPHLPPYLQRATIAVAPITYNAGIQNKLLEAMACATAVVTTPQAVANLPLKPERELLVAEGAPAFAQQIVRLLDNPDERARIGQAARRYVEQQHQWSTIAAQLEEIYTAVCQQNTTPLPRQI